jgi:hypothetical protein
VSTRIFFVSWIQKSSSRAHSCANTRPCRMDHEVIHSWSLQPWHSGMLSWRTRYEKNIFRDPCLAIIIPKNFGLLSSTVCNFLLMGVKCRVHYLVFTTDDEVDFLLLQNSRIFFNIGCARSAPDGSSPRGYSQFFFFEYRLKNSLYVFAMLLPHEYFYLVLFLSGARSVLPMGVAPEAMMGCLQPIIGSKHDFFD